MVNVILLEHVSKLGHIGDAVDVRPGYARNFLIPQGKAVRATEANIKAFEAKKASLEKENAAKRSQAEAVAKKLDGSEFVLIRQSGDSGQLYGSVTAQDIAAAINDAGHSVTRQQVIMDKPVKTVGLYEFTVLPHPEVAVTITINVAKSQDEAQNQKVEAVEAEKAEQAAEAEAQAVENTSDAGSEEAA